MRTTEIGDYTAWFVSLPEEPIDDAPAGTSSQSSRYLLNGRTRPVSDELRDAITISLEKELGFTVEGVDFIQEDSELRNTIDCLRNSPIREYIVKVLPANILPTTNFDIERLGVRPPEYLVPITIRAQLRPPQREYTVNLTLQKFDAKQVWEQIDARTHNVLDGLNNDTLRARDPEGKRAVLKILADAVEPDILQRGVGVIFHSIEVGNSPMEKLIGEETIGLSFQERATLAERRRGRLEHDTALLEQRRQADLLEEQTHDQNVVSSLEKEADDFEESIRKRRRARQENTIHESTEIAVSKTDSDDPEKLEY